MLDNQAEELKRKPIELNLAAAKKRKSLQTGFVHHCYASLPGEREDTIPVYENFCYALALLRSRLSDHVLEAKALLEKLIAFEVGGNFPIYLHEYPECKDRSLSLQALPILHWALADFRPVLGEGLCGQIEGVLRRILIHAERVHAERPLALSSWVKWKGYAAPEEIGEMTFSSAAQWADYLIALQMAQSRGADVSALFKRASALWDRRLHLFLGGNSQEKREPEVTLLDLFFGLSGQSFSKRALSDHPVHLKASLVYPFSPVEAQDHEKREFVQLRMEDPRQGYSLFWGGAEEVHSLVCDHRGSLLHVELHPQGADLIATLADHWESSEQPEIPLNLFCNLAQAHAFSIGGAKATTFQFGDEVAIDSEGKRISLRFACVEGDGVFFGHLLRANRPTQQSCAGALRFEAYDWLIAVRTVRRSSRCKLLVQLRFETL